MSFYAPAEAGKNFGSVLKPEKGVVRLCLGHYADTNGGPSAGKKLWLEVKDTSAGKGFMGRGEGTGALDDVVKLCFPTPKAYRRVWANVFGREAVAVWEPVPPSRSFVCLGVVAVAGEVAGAAPSLDAVRCVPRSLASKVEAESLAAPGAHEGYRAPRSLWDDCGQAAKPAACFSLGRAALLAVTRDCQAPERFWDWASEVPVRLDIAKLLASVPPPRS